MSKDVLSALVIGFVLGMVFALVVTTRMLGTGTVVEAVENECALRLEAAPTPYDSLAVAFHYPRCKKFVEASDD